MRSWTSRRDHDSRSSARKLWTPGVAWAAITSPTTSRSASVRRFPTPKKSSAAAAAPSPRWSRGRDEEGECGGEKPRVMARGFCRIILRPEPRRFSPAVGRDPRPGTRILNSGIVLTGGGAMLEGRGDRRTDLRPADSTRSPVGIGGWPITWRPAFATCRSGDVCARTRPRAVARRRRRSLRARGRRLRGLFREFL